MKSLKKIIFKLFPIWIALILITFLILNIKSINSLIQNLTLYINGLESISLFLFIIIFLVLIIISWFGFSFTIPIIAASLPINFFYAFFLGYITLVISTIIEFFIVRKLGRSYIENKFINKITKIKDYNDLLQKNGLPLILLLRFISLIPLELVNLFGALSKLKFRDYFIGTSLGLIPGLLITIYFLRNLTGSNSQELIISGIIFALFMLAPLLSKRIRKVVLNI